MASARLSAVVRTLSRSDRSSNVNIAIDATRSVTPTTRTAAPVARTLMESIPCRMRAQREVVRSPPIFRQPVARAADGLDRWPPERLVELAAQMPDVDLDDVRVAVEGEVPHVVEDLPLRHDLAGAA